MDAALVGLQGLEDVPLEEHHDRLASAHAALRQALDDPAVEPRAGDPSRP